MVNNTKKRRQQQRVAVHKRKKRSNETTKSKPNNSLGSKRPPRLLSKNFQIVVTDFLTDPCGLPIELRDCVLVDTTTMNETSDICSSETIANNTQVLKKILSNNESMEWMMKNSVSYVEDTCKKTNECEQPLRIDV